MHVSLVSRAQDGAELSFGLALSVPASESRVETGTKFSDFDHALQHVELGAVPASSPSVFFLSPLVLSATFNLWRKRSTRFQSGFITSPVLFFSQRAHFRKPHHTRLHPNTFFVSPSREYFERESARSLWNAPGELWSHPSLALHSARSITQGTRYVLIGFVRVGPRWRRWFRQREACSFLRQKVCGGPKKHVYFGV